VAWSESEHFLYLAYGSNLHPLRLSDRLGPVECLGKICLPGWRLVFDKRGSDGSAKANLRAAPGTGHEAWGALYRLDRRQYVTLDRFEGVGRGYETFWLDLLVDQREVPVLTYLSPSHWQLTDGVPHDWYLALVRLGARYHQFPQSVFVKLDRQVARPDPDPQRAERHRQLIARLGQAGLRH
jgi:gamma-glutamylcyclotransferase